MFSKFNRLFLIPLVVSALIPACSVTAKESESGEGRAGSWKKGTQGAPNIEECRKRVAKDPNDAIAQNDLGWAMRQNGDSKGAEKVLLLSIKLNDKSPYPHSNLSVVYTDMNRNEEALEEARKAVALKSDEPIFHVVLGNALSFTGDRRHAIEEYKTALKLKPDYENALYNLGRTLNDDGQVSDAKLTLSQALELDPDDERVVILLDKILQ
jgi:Flp pilus assembly protein TadD